MAEGDWKPQYFVTSGSYVYYNARFVARFKYMKSNIADFKRFLIKNFTPDEYFARLAAGSTPLDVLETKGYMPLHVRTALEQDGYPCTPEGRNCWIKDKIEARKSEDLWSAKKK